MTTVNLNLEDGMKASLEELCSEMGMNISTFFMIYAKKALRERRIPFEINASPEPFFSAANMACLDKSEEEIKNGRVVVKTLDELEAMCGE